MQDIEEKRKYWRDWYHRTGASKKYVKRSAERKSNIRQFIRELKSNLSCVKCGENHPATLDFHHINKDKEFNLFEAAKKGLSTQRITKEIEKCVCLCANCHRKEHYGHQTQGGSPPLEGGY